jgi:EmrB/QacA subfamily drug resistance transporter
MLLGPILGPVLGGIILTGLSWRWIFYVNVPIGAVALMLALRILPATEPRRAERLDLVGVALLSPGLAAIVFGLSEIATHGGIDYAGAWGPIAAGGVLVVGFVIHALRTRTRPLLDVRLFRAPGFAAAAITVLLVGGALYGAMLVIPLYLQVDRGASTLATGLLMTPQAIGSALVMPIAGWLTDRIGGGPVVLFGLVVMTVGSVGLSSWGADTSYWATSGILWTRGIGLGCCVIPAMAAAYATIDRSAIPRATTALNVLQRMGGSIGTALLAVVLQQQITAQLPHAPGIGGATIEPLPAHVRERVAVPLAHAFNHTFWWAAGLTAIGLVPGIVLAVKARISLPARSPQLAEATPEAAALEPVVADK